MLIGINPILTPDLLHSLASMGHGDRIVIVDANFPSAACARRLHYLPGLNAAPVLAAVLSLLPLDSFVPDPAVTMQVVDDPAAVPEVVREMTEVLERSGSKPPASIERFAFYEAARTAFAIIQTGEPRSYGNIILAKGIIASANPAF